MSSFSIPATARQDTPPHHALVSGPWPVMITVQACPADTQTHFPAAVKIGNAGPQSMPKMPPSAAVSRAAVRGNLAILVISHVSHAAQELNNAGAQVHSLTST